ncbi:hypothetical protein [Polaromonas sp.]|nr:hypothetical protein [Polaromonas sp.]NML85070.1 hypothetical protein [Polaromonas sp.]
MATDMVWPPGARMGRKGDSRFNGPQPLRITLPGKDAQQHGARRGGLLR